jgi:acetolactate synthase-1/2/3 large subunit
MHEALQTLHLPVPPPSASRAAAPVPLAVALVDALAQLGVRDVLGVVGGAAAALVRAVCASPLRFVHCRHEAGAAFAATELSLATGRPVVVLTTAGPGVTNALTGVLAARWEGARVILLSAATSAEHRGRAATQESSADTLPAGIYAAGGVFHEACLLGSPDELPAVCARLARRLARPEGTVAHLAVPIALQSALVQPLAPPALPEVDVEAPALTGPPDAALDAIVERLASGPTALWLGFGARHAAPEVRALAEALGAPVMTSPRAKGVFPESHPLWLGVTGVGGHPSVEAWMRRHRPDHVVVLGSRLGESTSFWSPTLRPARAFVHVDVDPAAFATAYRDVPTIGVVDDVAAFARRLTARWGGRPARQVAVTAPEVPAIASRAGGGVRPQAVMAALQREVLDATDVPVLAESGNAFAWTTHLLRVSRPGRYRVSTGFGSMGHMTCGVVGAALARGAAVAVVGDGAMLMAHEISTAAQYGVHAIWVVLNDAVYNMCDQGIRAMGWSAAHVAFPQVDFAGLAGCLGARGLRVDDERELDGALRAALAHDGPVVVDVRIDPAELAPTVARVRSLVAQAGGGA